MKHELIVLTGLLIFSTTSLALDTSGTQQIAEVEQRMQEVTPFAVDQTVESFTKTVHGGVQHLVVKSAANTRQIKLIQAYLLKLANDFRKGDFSVSERIHGAGMPGLAQLKTAKPDDIKFEYVALANGAQIHYSTEYPLLVQALHFWFDAQASDHGNNEIPGHTQHHATPAE
ncbi:MAG: aspartate carbamoyltransferase [Methylovulum sp.]|uniref:aspartate carbamoyltransferase n=1 Tax=Methylovulum sp. TaxID=1916980 RepID=UPI00262A9C91|nr:aspartate carbamoyltransferase [Methylovulum sp.]MDD2722835.1 aspartate carbamoyltransferase [Methylovulum sp.]MDD5124403.1 aspartate carbamoyltransferase [Methylovulum sp.]